MNEEFFLEVLTAYFASLVVPGSFLTGVLTLAAAIVRFAAWAWYRWYFAAIVESGQERYLSFLLLPLLAAVAGATSVGIDRLTQAETEPGTLSGWYLLSGGLGVSIVSGLWALRLMARRSPITAIAEALRSGVGVDDARALVDRYLNRVSEEKNTRSRRRPGSQGLSHDVEPIKGSVILAVGTPVWMAVLLLGEAFLLHPATPVPYVASIVIALGPMLLYCAEKLVRGQKVPMFTKYRQQLELLRLGGQAGNEIFKRERPAITCEQQGSMFARIAPRWSVVVVAALCTGFLASLLLPARRRRHTTNDPGSD